MAESDGETAEVAADNVPALALRLLGSAEDRHRKDLAELRGEVDDSLGLQLERIEKIEQFLDHQFPGEQPEEKPPDPQPWSSRASAGDLDVLADWVDWLLATYQPVTEYAIAPCWPAHEGAVEELAALRNAWAAAMLKDEGNPSDSAAYWHKNWLWPTFADVNKIIPNQCKSGTHKNDRQPRPTDRSLLPRQTTGPGGQTGPAPQELEAGS